MSYNQFQTLLAILIRDTRVFKQHILTRIIDACVWTIATLYVSQYVLPLFGIDQNFGTFLVAGNLAVWGMFEVGTNMAIIVSDLHGANSLGYYLSLPIPSHWIFIRVALIDAYKSIIPTLPLLPISKLILQDHFSFSSIYYPKLLLSWILAHIFFGFFGLFIASITYSLEYITTIRQRIIFPLWFIGCYQFTWHMLHQVSPALAYINLLNPMTFIMESMRASTNTSLTTLPFWLCILVILTFTVSFAYFGIRNFQKRLDCLS